MNRIGFLLLIFLLQADSARAEGADTLSPAGAAAVCMAYLKNPDDYKEVQTKQCDCHDRTNDVCECFYAPQEKGVTFARVLLPGSYSSTGLNVSFSGFKERGRLLEYKNSDENGFGGNPVPVTYNGRLYAVERSDGRTAEYLSQLDSSGLTVLCGFAYQLQSWEKTLVNNPDSSVCEKFQKGEYGIEGVKVEIEEEKDFFYHPLPPETHIARAAEVDPFGDGRKVNILTVDYASGRGPGCDRESLGVGRSTHSISEVDGEVIARMDNSLTDITAATGCYDRQSWTAITIGGKGYAASNLLLAQSSLPSETVSRWPFRDRVLLEYNGNDFAEKCRLEPKFDKVIDRMVLSPEELGYHPLLDK